MKKYLIGILFCLLILDALAQDYRGENHKTYRYPTQFDILFPDTFSAKSDLKWSSSANDTLQLINYISKQFSYPEFCRMGDFEGSFYFKIFSDSIGIVTRVEAIKPIDLCSHEMENLIKKILWRGFLIDRKKYPFEYFTLKVIVQKIQN